MLTLSTALPKKYLPAGTKIPPNTNNIKLPTQLEPKRQQVIKTLNDLIQNGELPLDNNRQLTKAVCVLADFPPSELTFLSSIGLTTEESREVFYQERKLPKIPFTFEPDPLYLVNFKYNPFTEDEINTPAEIEANIDLTP